MNSPSTPTAARPPTLQAWLASALLTILVTGCQSFNSPPDDYLASVNIQNKTVPTIAGVVQQVFAEHYFDGGASGPNTLVYTRPGSAMDNIAYGSFMNKNTTIQVVVTITPRTGGVTQLSCTAQVVTDAQDSFFADPHNVSKLGKEPYQKLLDEVQTRLK